MPFLGMRGTGDWTPNQRPEDWRELILYLYPNGSAPLTAIMSMLSSERAEDPTFHWFSKKLPKQAGDATNVFDDPSLSTGYTSGGTSGDVVYVQVAQALAEEFRTGHTVNLGVKGDYRYDTVGSVVNVTLNGSNSYVSVKLREDADATYDLDTIDHISIIGNSNPEGATQPESVSYDPDERENNTQIYRTALSITRTARKTRLRTGDAYNEQKREALELHAIEMEKSSYKGIKFEAVGPNGKPERGTRGFIRSILDFASANVDDYTRNGDYTGQAWTEGGETWLDEQLEQIFRFGNPEKLAIAGNGALLALQRLAKITGQINLEPMSAAYGLRVMEWITPFGTIYIKTAPLFSQTAIHRNDMLILEPEKIGSRFIDDTFFKQDNSESENTNNSRDGTEEEFLTEIGFEHNHEETMGFLTGFGKDA